MATKRIDPRLRAQLKEIARDIISRDRSARKYGTTQNTIGEIERALVRAFRLGQDMGDLPFAPPRPDHLGVGWEEVNPRGREVLRGLSYRHLQSRPLERAPYRAAIVVHAVLR